MTAIMILSVLIACLVTVVFFTIKGNMQLQKELRDTERDLHRAQDSLSRLNAKYIEVVSDNAWLRGLRIGQTLQEETNK